MKLTKELAEHEAREAELALVVDEGDDEKMKDDYDQHNTQISNC